MAVGNPALFALNRGLLSPLALARTDIKRQALSAEVQTNWMPRALGSMMLRPGLGFVTSTYANQRARYLPFVFATDDVALLEFTPFGMRIINQDAFDLPTVLLSRPSVSSAITNGNFAASLAGWTNADEAGTVSQWVAGNKMQLLGNGAGFARERQQITVGVPSRFIEHALRIHVTFGAVVLNVGTAAGDGTYAFNLRLGVGWHSIAFTPSGNFWVEFSNDVATITELNYCQIEGAGVVVMPTPWAGTQLTLLREDQSGEVLYVACQGVQQQKILRWGAAGTVGARSWSVVAYEPLDGPFGTINITAITLTPGAVLGVTSLTASAPLFTQGHVGALFRLTSIGQSATVLAGGANQWSSAIEATGLSNAGGRNINIVISGVFNATVVLQRSIGAIGAWENVGAATMWTAPITGAFNDLLDNQVVFYRIGIGPTYVSGAANCFISIALGSLTGIVRINGVSSSTSASAVVITQPGNTGVLAGLGSTNPTGQWSEGQWSNARGWPSSVALYEGRLAWAGKNRLNMSVSDAFESFNDTVVGDSGPINRTIGSGPVDVINWLLPLADLVAGTQGSEIDIRSSVLGGIITPTDTVFKNCSTNGSAAVPALRVDNDGYYLQRSGRRLYKLNYTPSYLLMNYRSSDVTNFTPDMAVAEEGVKMTEPGITWIALQRQPDTRIHCVLADGTARVLIINPDEELQCWIKVETDGVIEDIVILPGQGGNSSEDLVHYVVARQVGGTTVRYLERWAYEEDCWGATMSKCADSHVVGTIVADTTLPGFGHLIGQEIVLWGDARDLGTFVVDGSGNVTVPTPIANYCGGLAYEAKFKSAKLTYAAQAGSALNQKKRVDQMGLVMMNTHHQGIQYGKDFDSLVDLPLVYKGESMAADGVYIFYDDEQFPFPGNWDTDSRICLKASAPRPCTVQAVVIGLETEESL